MTVEKTLPVSEMNGLVISMDKIIEAEDKGVPLISSKKMLIEASWRIKMGINAKKIKVAANSSSKTITVTIPEIQINSMEQTSTPTIYDQSGSLLSNYSSQDVLDAVNTKQKKVKADILKDKDYRSQTIQSLQYTMSTLINSVDGVRNNYKIVYVTTD